MAIEWDRATVALVGRTLLGPENKSLSKGPILKWGTAGSMKIDIERAIWKNFETQDSGALVDLIRRHKGDLSGEEIADWVVSIGGRSPLTEQRRGPPQKPAAERAERAQPQTPRQEPKPQPAASAAGPKPVFRPTEFFDYVDETGARIFQVVRMEDQNDPPAGFKRAKTFRQRREARPDDPPEKVGREGWVWSVPAAMHVPYRLPRVLKAIGRSEPIYIVEGEKCVHRLEQLGLTATCNPGGAGKWSDQLSRWLAGAEVVLIPDNDEAGRKHVDLVGKRVRKMARQVRVLDLASVAGLGPKEDVADWVDRGGTAEQLIDFVDEQGVAFKPQDNFVSKYGRISYKDILKPQANSYQFLIDDLLTCGDRSIIGGESRAGKSFLALHMSIAIARGVEVFGRKVMQGLVVYHAGEGQKGIVKRVEAYRQHHNLPPPDEAPLPLEILTRPLNLWAPDGDTQGVIDEIKGLADIHDFPLRLVVIDTLATATGGADENSGKDMGVVMQNIARINQETGAAVMLVHHLNAGGTKLRGHTSIYANLDQVILVTANQDTGLKTMRLDKQKDEEDGIELNFRLKRVVTGYRDDGKEISSCVVTTVSDRPAEGTRGVPMGVSAGGAGHEIALRALVAAIHEHGHPPTDDMSVEPDVRVVHWSEWLEAYGKVAPFMAEEGEDGAAAFAQRCGRAIEAAGKQFLAKRIIQKHGNYVYLTGKPVKGFAMDTDRAAREAAPKMDATSALDDDLPF